MNEHDLAMYRGFISERDREIALLRKALVRYGEKARMSMVADSELQQAIDRAFENSDGK